MPYGRRRPKNRMLGNGIETFRVLQRIAVPNMAAIHRFPRSGFGPLGAKGLSKRLDLCNARAGTKAGDPQRAQARSVCAWLA